MNMDSLQKQQFSREVVGENAMVQLGVALGNACTEGGTIFLDGDLGAGKTTLSRGVLRSLGYLGTVKSPTYTLVEPYELSRCSVYHFDLYRLTDSEELEYMGIRDYFEIGNLCLVEWANKGSDFLPEADLIVRISPLKKGRVVSLMAQTRIGESIVSRLP